MPCHREPEAAERYVSGSMTDAERMGFEDHYFACDRCLGAVQALLTAQDVLREDLHTIAPSRPAFRAALLAAAAIVTVGVILWRLPSRPANTNARSSAPVVTAPVPPANQATPAATQPAAVPPALASADTALAGLAEVVAPPFIALTTRSDADADETAFVEAMRYYSSRKYAEAARSLQTIAARAPNLTHVQFFLGVSELLNGHTARAIAALQKSAASGISPYADEAHFYLAKAALREKNLAEARHELQVAIEQDAGPAGEAKRILSELKRLED